MNKFFIRYNISTIAKISLAGLFIALTTILQKVIAINYIPVVPFLRISLGGPAIIIFSSIVLGPLYGILVGAASDLLGYFIFDMSGYAFFPQVTAIYALLGLVSYFVFCLFRQIKNRKLMIGIECGGFLAVLVATTLYVILNNNVQLYGSSYTFELWQKICIPVILFVLLAFEMVFVIIYDKHLNKKNVVLPLNAYQMSFALFVIEVVVMVMFGTLMKGCAFGFQTYPMILICQIIVLFVNVPLNTVLLSLLLKVTKNRYKGI